MVFCAPLAHVHSYLADDGGCGPNVDTVELAAAPGHQSKAELVAGGRALWRVCRAAVREVLCAAVWAALADAGDLLPLAADRVFRGHRGPSAASRNR